MRVRIETDRKGQTRVWAVNNELETPIEGVRACHIQFRAGEPRSRC